MTSARAGKEATPSRKSGLKLPPTLFIATQEMSLRSFRSVIRSGEVIKETLNRNRTVLAANACGNSLRTLNPFQVIVCPNGCERSLTKSVGDAVILK